MRVCVCAGRAKPIDMCAFYSVQRALGKSIKKKRITNLARGYEYQLGATKIELRFVRLPSCRRRIIVSGSGAAVPEN